MFYELKFKAGFKSRTRFFFTDELGVGIELISGTGKFRVYLNSEQLKKATIAGFYCVEIGQNAVAL